MKLEKGYLGVNREKYQNTDGMKSEGVKGLGLNEEVGNARQKACWMGN